MWIANYFTLWRGRGGGEGLDQAGHSQATNSGCKSCTLKITQLSSVLSLSSTEGRKLNSAQGHSFRLSGSGQGSLLLSFGAALPWATVVISSSCAGICGEGPRSCSLWVLRCSHPSLPALPVTVMESHFWYSFFLHCWAMSRLGAFCAMPGLCNPFPAMAVLLPHTQGGRHKVDKG